MKHYKEFFAFIDDNSKWPSEQSWGWLFDLMLRQYEKDISLLEKKQRETGDPESDSNKLSARWNLVLDVGNILRENGGSVEGAIDSLPEETLQALEEAGYQIGNVASLKKLFHRADDELFDSMIQISHMKIKGMAKENKILKAQIAKQESGLKLLDKVK